MHADAEKLLWDARLAADRVARFIAGKSFADYLQDEYLRSAVERQFEIIGEALNRLSCTDPSTAATIDQLARVVAFRNILIHGYATVDNKLVWGVIETHLETLRAKLGQLLAQP